MEGKIYKQIRFDRGIYSELVFQARQEKVSVSKYIENLLKKDFEEKEKYCYICGSRDNLYKAKNSNGKRIYLCKECKEKNLSNISRINLREIGELI